MQTQPNKEDVTKGPSLNGELTAKPHTRMQDQMETAFDSRPANIEDARLSGYTDPEGKAIDMARPNVEGHHTGAYTDIGAGRSSVVKTRKEFEQPVREGRKTIENAPGIGRETAP